MRYDEMMTTTYHVQDPVFRTKDEHVEWIKHIRMCASDPGSINEMTGEIRTELFCPTQAMWYLLWRQRRWDRNDLVALGNCMRVYGVGEWTTIRAEGNFVEWVCIWPKLLIEGVMR